MMQQQNELITLVILSGFTLAGIILLIGLFICWCTMNKSKKEDDLKSQLDKSDSVLYKNQTISTISSRDLNSKSKKLISGNGDRKLAHSAQMFHYQLQKQQIIDLEKANNESKLENSDSSDNETHEGDYTVYECPGLAIIGVTEVINPLFKEDLSNPRQNFNAFSLINETNLKSDKLQG